MSRKRAVPLFLVAAIGLALGAAWLLRPRTGPAPGSRKGEQPAAQSDLVLSKPDPNRRLGAAVRMVDAGKPNGAPMEVEISVCPKADFDDVSVGWAVPPELEGKLAPSPVQFGLVKAGETKSVRVKLPVVDDKYHRIGVGVTGAEKQDRPSHRGAGAFVVEMNPDNRPLARPAALDIQFDQHGNRYRTLK